MTGIVRRPEDYPAEWAHLMQAFNRCAQEHDDLAALNAGTNFLMMVLKSMADARGLTRAEAEAFAQEICDLIVEEVANPTSLNHGVVVPMEGS